MSELTEKLNILKKSYIEKLKSELPIFDEFLDKPKNIENALELLKYVHKLSGTAGMYQLFELSKQSNEFESYLMEIKKDFTLLNPEKITNNIKQLKEIINKLEV